MCVNCSGYMTFFVQVVFPCSRQKTWQFISPLRCRVAATVQVVHFPSPEHRSTALAQQVRPNASSVVTLRSGSAHCIHCAIVILKGRLLSSPARRVPRPVC